MAIFFQCPSCGMRLEVDDNLAGATVKCPKCNAEAKAPAGGAVHPTARPAPDAQSPPRHADRDEFEPDRERKPKKSNSAVWIVCLVLLLGCCLLAVPAALIGLLVPAVQRVREAAARTATMNNLSQCAKAAHLAHDNNKKFPPYYGVFGPQEKKLPLTYHTHLLPFVDQVMLYNMPNPVANAIVPPYLSTLDPTQQANGAGACNFPVNIRLYYTQGGLGTLSNDKDKEFYPRMPQSFQQDGTSNTLLYATKYQVCGNGGSLWSDPLHNAPNSPTAAHFGVSMSLWQRAPTQGACDPLAGTPVSFNPTTMQVAMCDASVRIVNSGVSQPTWQAALTPNAGDVVGPDWDK